VVSSAGAVSGVSSTVGGVTSFLASSFFGFPALLGPRKRPLTILGSGEDFSLGSSSESEVTSPVFFPTLPTRSEKKEDRLRAFDGSAVAVGSADSVAGSAGAVVSASVAGVASAAGAGSSALGAASGSSSFLSYYYISNSYINRISETY
jgi:hypothetical protein